MLNSSVQFLAHDGTPDTFTQRKTRLLLHKLASSLRRSVSFLWFACGRGVVRVSRIRSAKIKTTKISYEESGGIFAKFRTSKKFPAIRYVPVLHLHHHYII